MAGIRSFVALELDAQARHDVGHVIDRLRQAGADVKWVAPQNLHLTLKFLGEVPAAGIPPLSEALRAAVSESSPFSFSLAGIGAFGPPANPRVVWVGVTEGKDSVVALAGRVEAAVAPLGYPPESRGLSAHLTVGRCRSARNAAELKAAMAALRDYRGPRVRADQVVLLGSDLRPSGPVYTPLAAFTL